MNTRFIDWIWHIRGNVALPPEQSSEETFDRLDPLFRQTGTSHRRTNDTLTFNKKDQPAQDKMAVFDSGVLKIETGGVAPVLHYHLISRILLFCFLLPLLFVGFAQLTIALMPDKPIAEAAGKSSDAAKKPVKAVPTLNPVDKFLGAPAPEKAKDGEEEGTGRKSKPSPTPAYVLAAIFATLYVIGRILEDRMVKSLFKKSLLGAGDARSASPFSSSASATPTGRAVQA